MGFDRIGRSNLRFAWLPKALIANGTDWAECVPDLIRRPGEGRALREGWCRDPPESPMSFSLFRLMGCRLQRALCFLQMFLGSTERTVSSSRPGNRTSATRSRSQGWPEATAGGGAKRP